MAFLPQFIDPNADFWTADADLRATFLVLAFANAFGYGLVASRARGGSQKRVPSGLFNRIGGTLLIGAGIAAASVRGSQEDKQATPEGIGERPPWISISTTSSAS